MTSISLSRRRVLLGTGALVVGGCAPDVASADDSRYAASPFRKLTQAEWRERLPRDAFEVLRQEATERPFSSPLNDEHRAGVFHCRGCDLALFRAAWKFESRTGWPSFWQADRNAIGTKTDHAIGIARTEYHCARCLGHQGHVFNDGPRPTGLRYCNNGVALRFRPS